MKKGFVALLLALAVIVLVSPGLIGKLAEESMDENLRWAATETPEVSITSQGYDRGWFSSEGQHRVEVHDGELAHALLYLFRESNVAALPALIIDTKIDHGLVAVTSMTRERGSLAPGLGRAISTLQLEFPDGSIVDLPGTVFSDVGLAGELTSNLVMDAGSFAVGLETAHWGNADLAITTSPSDNNVEFRGTVEELFLDSPTDEIAFGRLSFEGNNQHTRFGFSVGDVSASVASITIPSNWGTTETGAIALTSSTSLDGELISGHSSVQMEQIPFGDPGASNIGLEVTFDGMNAEAVGNLKLIFENSDAYESGDEMMWVAEDDLKQLFATGFSFDISRFDIAWPPGTVSAKLDIDVAPTDMATFILPSALAAMDAHLEFSIPAELFDYLVSLDPDVRAAAGLGFLRRNGDVYEMEATLKDGMVSVNGAPMPGLIPGMP